MSLRLLQRLDIRRVHSIGPLFSRRARYLSSKDRENKDLENIDFENKDEKELSRMKVFVKDEKNNFLGIKSLAEAKFLANKHHMNLIEDKVDTRKHKHKVLRLVSNVFLARIEAQTEIKAQTDDNSAAKAVHKEPKGLVFSTKLSDNDLMTKIKLTKRWLSRGHNVSIHVTNPKKDSKLAEDIYAKFDSELKRFAKFNQKKIKSDKSLKFVVVANADAKEQLRAAGFEDNESDDIDVSDLDPNQLLSDEFEQQIDEELKKSVDK